MLKSIKMKLVLAFLVTILIPISIIGIIVNNSMIKEITDEFVTSTTNEVAQVDGRMALFFDTVKENVKFLADSPIINQADDSITSYMKLTENKKSTLAQNGGIESEIYREFERFAQTHPNTSTVFLGAAHSGYVQWPEKEMAAKYDPRTRPWYANAMSNPDQVTITDPYVDSVTGNLNMSSVAVVHDANGKPLGVLGLDTSLGKLAEQLQSIKIRETGYVVLLSKDGTILADPRNPELISKNIADIGVPEFADIKEKTSDHFEIQVDGTDYMTNLYTSQATGWKYLSIVEKSELTREADKIGMINLITSSICAVLAVLLALGVALNITKPIQTVVANLKAISAGDFTGEVPASIQRKKDEVGVLGQSLQVMQASIRHLVGEIRSAANTLADSSKQLSAHTAASTAQIQEVDSIVKIVASGADTQMRGTEEGAKAMEEMAIGIQRIAESTTSISETSLDTADQAKQGNMLLQEAVRQMNTIDESVRHSGGLVQTLGERSEQMAHIVDVITQIASQTNLLALNAAIEASRAGEHGQGFAVVAHEVRKLAERSAESAREISDLIEETRMDARKAVESMDLVRDSVADGIEKVQNSGATFERILTDITDIAGQIQDTSAVTEEMSAGSEEVLASVNEIAHIAEKNAEHATKLVKFTDQQLVDMGTLLKNAEQLNQMAQTLNEMISRYKM
ncbi:methyl-accepting chemotaxis protein [Paenibacillus melissococcoides]|uniref:Methyl-accepting chemotaxis protein n=1 Tax=Paenibacillus melissococcoides TaxID=2912268 RepID=A0ABN8TZP2_9BACL|nr:MULTISPECIES: methyl-accepting chemotaxis protein [Paenibacillus]MEB9893538.1 methyl-accepting chemotaxis protein [Bacillus cereus]CAH8243255.1 methyl-accepting chemotaxis protein [Paenibacillus melissococcoides]CAH8704053.1 methyl-accepting chemotaxis protein [Paenibacillus melissococcoides]CAH8707241.1 methyl-accepting chemotaxis protein [Paenibacillus melissococcoides]GIO76841.1 methyl-accepting chemotaxis protein [Paenibacillus dendritiformis]